MPSLSVTDEAIELFIDRARLAQTGFTVTDDNAATIAEICQRLDGMPLAIELAAARVRALSVAEILDSLHDRFRLLTGGARTAVRRQQTLRASVDWSHALLTEPERVLFRRLAAFLGGFDLDARPSGRRRRRDAALPGVGSAHPVGGQVAGGGRRQRGRERATGCWRRCASTRPRNWASPARPTSCAHVTATTMSRWPRCSIPRRANRLRAASSSRPKSRSTTCAPPSPGVGKTQTARARWRWHRRCSPCGARGDVVREGLAWLDAALADLDTHHREVAAGARARALADQAMFDTVVSAAAGLEQAEQALAIARGIDDPALLARALTACALVAVLTDARGGPAVLRRGDRPGPSSRRPVETQPTPRVAGAQGGGRGG